MVLTDAAARYRAGVRVQLIKLVQEQVGMGNERVRLPRLRVSGAMRENALKVVADALAARPELS